MKKLLTPLAVVLAIGLVMAASYYAMATLVISINQPIEVSGETNQKLDCDAGDTCRGDGINVSNDGESEREIIVTDNSDTYSEAIDDIRYIGMLQLSQKNTSNWELEENKVDIEYVVIGDEFSAEVVGDGIEGYELVYYRDAENNQTVAERTANPQPVIRLSEISTNYLPHLVDGNWQEDTNYSGEPDYYNQWKGAKLWYVPSEAIDESDNTLDWSQWSSFYYETDLIQYNSDGEIVLFPGASLTIYPEVDLNKYASEGNRTLEVTIA